MNRKFLLLIFVIFISVAVRAEISQHTAFGIALEWFKNSGFEVSRSNNDVESIPLSSLDNDNSYYIFNNSHGAYVIISGYDEENPIIGYSKESEWDNENIPPFLEEMLSNYKEAYLSRSGLPMPQMVNTRQDKSVYHKTANWGQGQPYNDMVDNKYPIGCVATAIAIVLRHYESPLPGNGTHSYLAPFKNETYSFDFNRKFDWNKMPMDMPKMGYSEDEAKAISELCFAAAVASDMSFTPNASGAIARPYSIQKFFNYSQDIISHRSDYNELESLQEIIYEDLENGRIVICSGGGHCFVCDGYEGEFFHFNFGWDGNDNGYFRLSDIAPVENGYPYVNFITGIHPANEMDVEGTPWRIAKGSLDAVGITVRAERIEKGKQYDFSINDLQSLVSTKKS